VALAALVERIRILVLHATRCLSPPTRASAPRKTNVGIVVAFGVHLNVSLEPLMHPISVARPTLLEFPVIHIVLTKKAVRVARVNGAVQATIRISPSLRAAMVGKCLNMFHQKMKPWVPAATVERQIPRICAAPVKMWRKIPPAQSRAAVLVVVVPGVQDPGV